MEQKTTELPLGAVARLNVLLAGRTAMWLTIAIVTVVLPFLIVLECFREAATNLVQSWWDNIIADGPEGDAGGGDGYPHLDRIPAISLFAMGAITFVFVVALVVLGTCLPVYLFSSNQRRAHRAGELTKSAFKFFVASAAAFSAGLGFNSV